MKPLVVLLVTTLIATIVLKLLNGDYQLQLAATIGMAVMLLFTAMGHFVFTKGMAMMIPQFIPFKTSLVYFTGVLEILIAIGLLMPKYSVTSGWVLVIFLVLMLPANIYASVHHINYQKATFDGHGTSYLWFRIPLQLLFIVWTYVSTIKLFQN